VLESLQAVCSDSKLLFTLYRVYDCAEDVEEVLREEEEVLVTLSSNTSKGSKGSASSVSSSSSPTAALALLKNDEAKVSRDNTVKKEVKRPVPLISNLVNVISHFLTQVCLI
jgi:hypothetical protein